MRNFPQMLFGAIKSWRIRWKRHVARMREERGGKKCLRDSVKTGKVKDKIVPVLN
jgi:hypothetical protein